MNNISNLKKKIQKKIVNQPYSPSYFKKLKQFEKKEQTDKILKLKFGRFLMMLRVNAKMTQQAVADEMEINRVTWAKYETGAILPARERLYQIAEVFSIDSAGLFQRAGYGGDLSLWDNTGDYEREAVRRLKNSIVNSKKLGEFLLAVHLVWIDYQSRVEQLGSDRQTGIKLASQIDKQHISLPLINSVMVIKELPPEQQVELIGKILLGNRSKEIIGDPLALIALRKLIVKLREKYKAQKIKPPVALAPTVGPQVNKTNTGKKR